MAKDPSAGQGIIFKIQRYSIHDGPGIRTTVFLKGCPLDCPWCHNPEGRDPAPETIQRQIARPDGGSLAVKETVGSIATVDQVMAEVEKDRIFYDESSGGVTFSGGEPLSQAEFLHALVWACTEKKIHVAVDTTGYGSGTLVASLMDKVDLWLFDLKLMDDAAHRRHTGVSNQKILKNLKFITQSGGRVRIRFPLVPGINDSEENIAALAGHVRSLGTVQGLDLLPYHGTAQAKYNRLDRPFRLMDVKPPSDERVAEIREKIQTFGLKVHVGG